MANGRLALFSIGNFRRRLLPLVKQLGAPATNRIAFLAYEADQELPALVTRSKLV